MPHQKFQSAVIKPRYAKGALSSFGSNSVYPRIPWVAAWWSLTFPGFGHIYLGRYLPTWFYTDYMGACGKYAG